MLTQQRAIERVLWRESCEDLSERLSGRLSELRSLLEAASY